MKKILYGVCGIGNGHTFRQLPIITTFAEQETQIMIFAYGTSYRFYENFAKDYPHIRVERVAVPFYQGSPTGLDFATSLDLEQNKQNFFEINCQALAQANQWLGKPDLVISDYEPVSAQYAYAHHAHLITIDQQSKYLVGTFPQNLSGQSYGDEVMRLRLFFPKAYKRIACSFFDVERREDTTEQVIICPPPIRQHIKTLQRCLHPERKDIIVYFSEQHFQDQSLQEIISLLEKTHGVTFHVFLPHKHQSLPPSTTQVTFYHHGDVQFDTLLSTCHGIIATAGHTLLSEAMHLGIPVLALTLPIYEQLMNGHIIATNDFGMACQTLDQEQLTRFIQTLPHYAKAICQDTSVLLKAQPGESLMDYLT